MRIGSAPRRRRTSIVVVCTVLAVLASLVMPWSTSSAPPAQAADARNFDAGNIISDANFYDGGSMTTSQIQSFMQQRRPDCAAGYTCLPQYAQATPAMAANRYCSAMAGSGSESAASIVARVGAACGVSPRVLLVLLEKEQSLVTHRSPNGTRYSSATGFACPDTAPCDSSFGGFFYQVYYAARQFQVYRAFPGSYNHQPAAWNNILFHPNSACGTSRVYVANQATAGLYNYTPYQPNAAALGNLYGTGDACSAYGNRNFWRIFSDWFGDPRGPLAGDPSPIVRIESTTTSLRSVRITGWALDPDTSASLEVHTFVNGVAQSGYRADGSRPDVGRAYGLGDAHGFDITVGLAAGTSEVCLAFINVGAGQNTWSCQQVSTPTGSPIGSIDTTRIEGSELVVAGWTIDPDTASSIEVHAYIGTRFISATRADQARPDVGRVHPAYGPAHGYTLRVPLPVGTSDVSIAFVNVGGGSNTWKTVEGSLASGPPFGSLDVVTATGPGTVSLGGWAIDPDTADPIQAHVYVDGRPRGALVADASRPDVGRANPGYGNAHGYSTTLSGLTGGVHEVCVAYINVRAGSNVWRCKSVTLPSGSPFGNFENASVSGANALVSGWSIDPDTAAAVELHVYVNGGWGGRGLANQTRTDVGRAYPAYGADHGFSLTVPIPAGRSEVCVAAINVGAGSTTWLACRTLTR
ncbi:MULTISPECIES: hypothetical protein [unclassified Agrococcus]|uniref:hypothetical protein n=1 Tax=unclassified Agrococcus TaxID=2615065 RepID=UPI003614A2C4